MIVAANRLVSLVGTIGNVDSTTMTGIPSHFGILQSNLQDISLRHQVASQNIANVNTPGYKTKEVVSFGEALTQAGAAQSRIRATADLNERLDGNNVDIDKEIGGLEKNSMLHSVYTQILASKIRQMRSAITGR